MLSDEENEIESSASAREVRQNPLWDYYTKTGKETRQCSLCKQSLTAQTGTTTTLQNHLKRKHPVVYLEFCRKKQEFNESHPRKQATTNSVLPTSQKQLTIPSVISKYTKWSNNSVNAKAVTAQIGRFIAKGFHPFTIVEEPEFQKLLSMKEVCPNYEIPSRFAFSRTVIPKMYDSMTENIKNEIHTDIKAGVESLSFSSDTWTARNNDSYMSLTIHYLTPDFELKCRTLGCEFLPSAHTAQNLHDILLKMFTKWGLVQINVPYTYVTTDNGANMVASIRCGSWSNIKCFDHTLQLVIKNSIEELTGVENLLSKARAIVGHYKRSSSARKRLHEEEKKEGLNQLELIQEVDTRWNSTFLMLQRLILLRKPIAAELGSSDTTVQMLNGNDWKMAQALVELLEPFAEATEEACGQKYPTISMVLPMLYGLQNMLSEFIGDTKELHGKNMARVLLRILKSKFQEVENNNLYLCATLVDPRYKTMGIKEDSRTHATLQLKKMVCAATGTVIATPVAAQQDEDEPPLPKKKKSLWDYFDSKAKTCVATPETTTTKEESLEEKMVDTYLNMARIARHDNPLLWWKQNKHVFPCIAKVAQNLLGIVATSVPSERLFSSGGNVVTCRRERLSTDHVEQLIVLHDNM